MLSDAKLRIILLLACCAALLLGVRGTPLAAQATVGTILGTVTDSSGAVIPEATVRITNAGTGAVQNTSSDAQGRYRVPDLAVGDYDVQTEKDGFQTVVHKGVALTVGSEQVVDFSVPVGQVTQTVTVEGEVSEVETTNSSISDLVDPTQMRELPLNGRNFEQLILLQPGVTIMQAIGFAAANGFGNSYSVSGSRGRGQWEILDDNDVTNYQDRNSGGGVLGTSLGVDAIAEFQVLTNTYGAQYGGNGSVVNSVTKSGTNALHGSGYEFFRNSALDARNFFDPPTIPLFQKNQFGGTLGGPIKKDKMFFFTNYEGVRQNTGYAVGYILPDAAGHSGFVPDTTGTYQCVAPGAPTPGSPGALTYPANAAACAALIPAAIQQFLPYLPTATNFPYVTDLQSNGSISGLLTAFETAQAPGSENYVVGRYDWAISSKDSMFARYLNDGASLVEANNSATPSPLAPHGWGAQDNSKNQFLSIEEKHIWSNNLINSTRFGSSRTLLQSYIPDDYGSLWQFNGPSKYGFPAPLDGQVTISPLVNPNFPVATLGGGSDFKVIQNKFSGGEDIFWNKGAHGLRFGVSATRVQTYRIAPPSGGTWSFANMTSFLTDTPQSFAGTCIPALFVNCGGFSGAAIAPHELLESDFGLYVQDDWKVRNTVTLNIGLRYEPNTNPWDAFGTLQAGINAPLSASFNPSLPMPGCLQPTAIAPVNCPTVLPAGVTGFTPITNVFLKNPSLHNIDPRIGIAWDPFNDHRTSVRAGYGIFHSPISPYDESVGFTNAPAGTSVLQACVSAAACSAFPTPFQSAGAFSPTINSGVDYGDKQTGYMQQYNLTVQREIGKNTTLTVGYNGSRGLHLIGLTDENPNLPTGVPGAITTCAAGCNLKPGQVLMPYPPVAALLTGGTPTAPTSANGKAIVDPTDGRMSYSNVVATTNPATGATTYSVVQNNRIDPAVGFYSLNRTTFWSRYNSLQAGLVRRLTNNFQLQISYTYASCITNSSGSTGFEGQIVGANSYDVNSESGNCAFAIRNNFYTNGIYILPFHKNRLVSGWQLGGILQYHTGTPVFVGTGWNTALWDRSGSSTTNRPDAVAGCKQVLGTVSHWDNSACFTMPPIGEPGNLGMNTVIGPDSMTFDGSVVKNTKISERLNVQFRAEVFNLFNRANFRNGGQPADFLYQQKTPLPATCATTPSTCSNVVGTFSQLNLTNTPARQIQLGLKAVF